MLKIEKMLNGTNVLIGGKRPKGIQNGFYYEPTVIEASNTDSIS